MPAMSMIEAIRDAHFVAMERDDKVVVFGEDVGYFGGVFRCTQGLQEKFGDHRCFVGTFRAQTMVHRGRFDPARPDGLGQQQQGQAVGSAGDGDAEPCVGSDKRIQIGSETLNCFRRRPHQLSCTWPRPWRWAARP